MNGDRFRVDVSPQSAFGEAATPIDSSKIRNVSLLLSQVPSFYTPKIQFETFLETPEPHVDVLTFNPLRNIPHRTPKKVNGE